MATSTATDFAGRFLVLLSEKFPVNTYGHNNFSITRGRKYDKIVRDRSVYAFVNKSTGELCKASSWGAPAFKQGTETFGKYFLSTDEGIAEAIFNADEYGGFLYNDYIVQVPAEGELVTV